MEEITTEKGRECPNCYVEIKGKPQLCVACDFPLEGTRQEQDRFIASKALLLREKQRAKKVIFEARIILFIAATFELLAGLYVFFQSEDSLALIISLVIFLVYLLLGFWTQTKPLTALICGMAFFLLLILAAGMIDPDTLTSGLIFRLIVFVLLAKGINSAMALNKKY